MLEKMRVIIVDDLIEARDELKYLLSKYADVEVIAEAETPDAAWDTIQEENVDVVFLDIIFDNITDGERAGFDLAKLINQLENPPYIVFFTTHSEYALEAFSYFPLSFLPKPFDDKELREVLTRLRQLLEYRLKHPRPRNSIIEIDHRMLDKSGNNIRCTEFVSVHDIIFIKTNLQENTVRVRLTTGKTLNNVNRTLKSFYTQLQPYGLHIRVHNSSIAAIKHISGINNSPNNDTHKLTFKFDTEELSVGSVFLRDLLTALREQMLMDN